MGNGAAAGSDRAAMKVCKPYFGGAETFLVQCRVLAGNLCRIQDGTK